MQAHVEIEEIYRTHCPDKLDKIHGLLEKFKGREALLLRKVKAKYGTCEEGCAENMLEKTVAIFKRDPRVDNLHEVAFRKYDVFCRHRTADLYTTFLALVGDQDFSWCNDAAYLPSFKANAPFPGKQHERTVSGGASRSKEMHGLVRYEYKRNIIEECRKDGRQHGLRVVCTQMGDVWVRLYEDGERLAQIVLNADLSIQSSIDDGGLPRLRQHIHLVQSCFAETEQPNAKAVKGQPSMQQHAGHPGLPSAQGGGKKKSKSRTTPHPAEPPDQDQLELEVVVLREYGVVLLRGALSLREQEALFRQHLRDACPNRGTQHSPANFHLSSRKTQHLSSRSSSSAPTFGSTAQYVRPELHELGNLLFARTAQALARLESEAGEDDAAAGTGAGSGVEPSRLPSRSRSLSPSPSGTPPSPPSPSLPSPPSPPSPPSLRRLRAVHSGQTPAGVETVTGVCYHAHHLLANHTDLSPNLACGAFRPLHTMSVALGDACEFTFGEKTLRPSKHERAGEPVRLRMESGDAMFFDGGSVPHAVNRIERGTAPAYWRQGEPKSYARVSVLFREGL